MITASPARQRRDCFLQAAAPGDLDRPAHQQDQRRSYSMTRIK
jgi:hypothetical protein